MDRAEATGVGASLAGHAAVLAALTLGFATVKGPPLTNPPIEVSFVDEIGLESAVPQPSSEPPAQSMAPEIGAPEEATPEPEPVPEPEPKAKAEPKEAVKPEPVSTKAAPKEKAAPAKAERRTETKAASKQEKTRGSRLGKDFLKGLGLEANQSKSQTPSGAVMSATAMTGIVAAIQRQIQPCADRQVNPGPGANRIVVKLNLRLNSDGSLAGRPRVVSFSGVDDENDRYQSRVADLAIAAFTGCSPLRDLPKDLYSTPRGGWSNFNMNYKLPG